MHEATWADPGIRGALARLKASKPFVYGLTNYVAANLTANVLLAVGAAPAIGAAPGWPHAFGAAADAVWINTAALMSSDAATLLEAARAAHEAAVPWVLDPVAYGAGATAYDDIVRSLLAFRPTVIRGNASELIALGGGLSGGKGVETAATADEAVGVVQVLARDTGAVVAVSGATDYIAEQRGGESRIVRVTGGDARLTQVTGAGCSLGALIAALLPMTETSADAACAAHVLFALAAERAAPARGTASFAQGFLDALSLLDPAE